MNKKILIISALFIFVFAAQAKAEGQKAALNNFVTDADVVKYGNADYAVLRELKKRDLEQAARERYEKKTELRDTILGIFTSEKKIKADYDKEMRQINEAYIHDKILDIYREEIARADKKEREKKTVDLYASADEGVKNFTTEDKNFAAEIDALVARGDYKGVIKKLGSINSMEKFNKDRDIMYYYALHSAAGKWGAEPLSRAGDIADFVITNAPPPARDSVSRAYAQEVKSKMK